MSVEGLQPGLYQTPFIGDTHQFSPAETRLDVTDDLIQVYSPLYDRPYSIGNGQTFKDPRTDQFLFRAVEHQLHHLDTRQLNLPEHIETRPGAGRYSRLGGLLDSAKILQDLGATYEQIVQTLESDFAHPAGSHLRGDFLAGDYEKQDTHDGRLRGYIEFSGFADYLRRHRIIDEDGTLTGSQYTIYDLADPSTPRRHDITECPRPDPNADRLEFTLHEGLLIHDPREVRDVLSHVIRVETADGERMALTDPDAARLLFKLAVRHQSEHWGEPMHRVQDEVMLHIDRYAAVSNSPVFAPYQEFHPTDYAYTAEHAYYERLDYFSGIDPLVASMLALAKRIAAQQRELPHHSDNDEAYDGPVLPKGTSVVEHDYRTSLVSVKDDEVWFRLKAPKYRGPIDALVVTAGGLLRASELMPDLKTYEQQRKRWLGPLLVRMKLPSAELKEIGRSVPIIRKTWGAKGDVARSVNPLFRPHMPQEVLEPNIAYARQAVAAHRVVA